MLCQPVADAVLVETVATLAHNEWADTTAVKKVLCGDLLGFIFLLALALDARVCKVIAADRTCRRTLIRPHRH